MSRCKFLTCIVDVVGDDDTQCMIHLDPFSGLLTAHMIRGSGFYTFQVQAFFFALQGVFNSVRVEADFIEMDCILCLNSRMVGKPHLRCKAVETQVITSGNEGVTDFNTRSLMSKVMKSYYGCLFGFLGLNICDPTTTDDRSASSVLSSHCYPKVLSPRPTGNPRVVMKSPQQACSQRVGWRTDSARTLHFESNVLTQQMFWVLLGWMSHHDAWVIMDLLG